MRVSSAPRSSEQPFPPQRAACYVSIGKPDEKDTCSPRCRILRGHFTWSPRSLAGVALLGLNCASNLCFVLRHTDHNALSLARGEDRLVQQVVDVAANTLHLYARVSHRARCYHPTSVRAALVQIASASFSFVVATEWVTPPFLHMHIDLLTTALYLAPHSPAQRAMWSSRVHSSRKKVRARCKLRCHAYQDSSRSPVLAVCCCA